MHDGSGSRAEWFWIYASDDELDRTTDLARRILNASAALIVTAPPGSRAASVSASQVEAVCTGSPQGIFNRFARRVMDEGSLKADDLGAETVEHGDSMAIGAFMGVAIRNTSGEPVGALCVVDARARRWHDNDLDILDELAASIATRVTLRIAADGKTQAEAALDELKAWMLVIADNIPGLVFERRKVGHSSARYRFFGSSKEALPGTRELMEGDSESLSFVHPDDRDRVREALRSALIAEIDLDLTFRVPVNEHDVRWLRSQSVFRRDSDGTAVWDGLCFDITDLMVAREAAQTAQSQKDTLLVDVNHELRTPLQAIIGFADFLGTETKPDVVKAHALTIKNASSALLSIVNQLLDLASGDHETTSTREPTDVKHVASLSQAMVAPLALKKAITSRLSVDADVPDAILADGPKIQQVLLNLLNNAIKFTESGSVTLHVARNGANLRFSVADTGIGIPEGKMELLFQRFSRIAPGEGPARGTGLGLAIAKRLVEQMNGTIDVASHADRGTTFWFEVPAEPVPGGPLLVEPAADPSETLASGARILVADDLDLNRRLISDMLSLEGLEVDCVSDGAQAVQAVKDHGYDLVLMDMIMPVMDGLAATRAIRTLPAPACDVAIIALTAHSFKEQLDSCLAAGMDATITKPMSLDVLMATVKSWMGGRRQAA